MFIICDFFMLNYIFKDIKYSIFFPTYNNKYEFIYILIIFTSIQHENYYQVLIQYSCIRMTIFFTTYFVHLLHILHIWDKQRGLELEISLHRCLKVIFMYLLII